MSDIKQSLLFTLVVCLLTGFVVLVAVFANYMEDNYGLIWGIGVMVLFAFGMCFTVVTLMNRK